MKKQSKEESNDKTAGQSMEQEADMNEERLLAACDHTQLRPEAIAEDILRLCREAEQYHTASVCVPPCYVALAKQALKGAVPVCTVIGFPNGYNHTAVKVLETQQAVADGADEIDMVINIGFLKSRRLDEVREEIVGVREACPGKILKVIIETCLLTDEEKRIACEIAAAAGADFVKTSTGFSSGGATVEDVRLMRAVVGGRLKVKASGGISSLEEARALLDAGADRLGTSKVVALISKREERHDG